MKRAAPIPVVTCLTDFGLLDSYVAEVKAVLIKGHRSAQLIDITHQVPAQDIESGAFHLLRAHAFFPRGTVHLAIVDPGVGTSRRAIYVRTRDYHFVGPDNGLLLWAVRACEWREQARAEAFEIPMGPEQLPTFHGRDVFAPFVVTLIKRERRTLRRLTGPLKGNELPEPREEGGVLVGEVLHIDTFGNVVTSVPATAESQVEAVTPRESARLVEYPNYEAIPPDKVGVIRGSHGFWELAGRRCSAAEILGLRKRDRIIIRVKNRR